MPRKQGNGIDLQKAEITNVRAQNLASAPSSPALGQFYFDTVLDRMVCKGASAFIDPTNRTSHTGSQPSSSISDLASVVKAYKLNEFGAPTADISLGGFKASNAANPVASGDLATKAYVDNVVNGLDWKASVRAVATANVTQSGPQTIDGVALIAGDRVLCVGQTAASTNGVWVVAAGAWTRAADASTGTLSSGLTVMVTEGSTNGDQQWRLLTNDPISVGADALTFTQIGAVVSLSGTNGVTVTGNQISLDNAVAVRKAAGTIGDGAQSTWVVTHNLNTADVTVGVYQLSDGDEWTVQVAHTSVNAVTLTFATAPTLNQFRVVVHG